MTPIELTSATFDEVIKDSATPILVDFWAVWCGPCRAMGPILDQMAEEMDGELAIGKVNVDECGDLAQRFGITSIPCMILFKGGEPVAQNVGAVPKDVLVKSLQPYL